MTTNERIQAGDRVKSATDGTDLAGVVQSISCEITETGPNPVFSVLVDKCSGQACEPYLVDRAANLWTKTSEPAPPPSPDAKCPSCGEVHPQGPFTDAMYKMVAEYQKTHSIEEKHNILEDLALQFIAQVDPTQFDLPESIHDLIAKRDAAMTKLHDLDMTLGRLVVRNIVEIQAQKGGLARLQKLFFGADKKEEGLN